MADRVSAIIKEGPRFDDFRRAVEDVVGPVEVYEFPPQVGLAGMFKLRFDDPEDASERRELNLDFNAHDEEAIQDDILQELGGAGTIYVSLGAYGSARRIIQHVAERFDGWMCDETIDSHYVKAADFDMVKGLPVR